MKGVTTIVLIETRYHCGARCLILQVVNWPKAYLTERFDYLFINSNSIKSKFELIWLKTETAQALRSLEGNY